MRRSDREISDKEKIRGIIRDCDVCRLGFADHEEAYIVPMNFGYKWESERLTLYFHSAKAGRKIELARTCKTVSFEMDTAHALIEAATACGYGMKYQCVMGQGKLNVVLDKTEKAAALKCFMEHYTKRQDLLFEDSGVDAVCVMKLEAETISCKEHN